LFTQICTIPVPEMKFSAGCVPSAVPFRSLVSPDMPAAPLQLVLLVAGSSVQPPPVKFSAGSGGRLVPAF
jgi:hypothetical protein